MKCNYCGGEIGLEEKTCPYCGMLNDQAVQHHQNMTHFRERFDRAEKNVARKAWRYSQAVPRFLIIVLLLLGTAATILISENAYSFPDASRRRAAMKNPAQTKAVLDAYLDSGDYLSFSSYMEYCNIRTYGTEFSEYRNVDNCAYDYKDFVISLEKLFLHGDQDKWLRYSASFDIRRLCEALEDFTDSMTRAKEDDDEELHMANIEEMNSNMKGMLRVFLGITDEHYEDFLAMTDNHKAAYIEEVILGA